MKFFLLKFPNLLLISLLASTPEQSKECINLEALHKLSDHTKTVELGDQASCKKFCQEKKSRYGAITGQICFCGDQVLPAANMAFCESGSSVEFFEVTGDLILILHYILYVRGSLISEINFNSIPTESANAPAPAESGLDFKSIGFLVLALILVLLTIVGLIYMCRRINCNLKEKCCKCCVNLEKEDENPDYGTYYNDDGDRRLDVMEVTIKSSLLRLHNNDINMIEVRFR